MIRRRVILAGLLLCATLTVLSADAVSWYRQGLRAFERGDSESVRQSLGYFRRAVEENPYYFRAWRSLGLAYHRLGYYRLARPALEKALEQQPDHIEASLAYAETLIALGNSTDSRTQIDKVLHVQPRNVQALYVDALWWYHSRRSDLALERIRSVHALAPHHVPAWLLRGSIMTAASQWHAAEEAYRQAVRSQPHSAEARYGLGRYLFDRGRWREAVEPLRQALDLDRELHKALEPWGRCQFLLGDYAAAADAMQRLTLVWPHAHMYRYLLAQASARMAGESDEWKESARTNFALALRLRNNDEVIRYSFEEFATAHLPLRSDERKELAGYHLQLGDFWYGRNHEMLAEISYRRAIRLDPYSKGARGHLARISRRRQLNERYLGELELLAEIDRENTRLADTITYYQNLVPRLPSRQRGIRQYEVSSSLASVVVTDLFEPWDVRHGYHDAGAVMGSLLRDALTPEPSLRLVRLGGNGHSVRELVTARQRARAAGAEYFVHGRYVLGDNSVRLEATLRHAASGEALTNFVSSRRGNHALYEAACDIGDKLTRVVPLVGQIVRIQGNEVQINLGRVHGIQKGSVFQVFQAASFRERWLATLGRIQPAQPIGEITVQQSDEVVSFGEITEKETFGGITTYQYLLVKPKDAQK